MVGKVLNALGRDPCEARATLHEEAGVQIAQSAQPGLEHAIGADLDQRNGALLNFLCEPLRQFWMLFQQDRKRASQSAGIASGK